MIKQRKTAADWQRWLTHEVDLAKQWLLAHQRMDAAFVLHCSDGARLRLSVPLHGPEQKDAVHRYIGLLCHSYDVDGLCSITEAWVRSIATLPGESQASKKRRANESLPSKAADRMEMLTVMLIYRSEPGLKHGIGLMERFARDQAGRLTGFDPFYEQSAGAVGDIVNGAVPDLLPAKPISAATRAMSLQLETNIGAPLRKALDITLTHEPAATH